MKKLLQKIIAFSLFFAISFSMQGQQTAASESKGEHKIIFQFTSNDTILHKQLMKQFNNVLTVAPNTKIEVVCQGGGLELLMSAKTIVGEKIKSLSDRGVHFVACEFAMKERKIERSQMLPVTEYVQAGIIEIVSKQEQGWSYIRSGN
jgi:intracellular sulfur oxidation DsrE/DsrF family protein